jgi:PST family polysaccharide transporter
MNASELTVTKSEVFAGVSSTDDLRRNLRGKSVRGAIYLALGGGGELLLRLVSTAILARLLVPEHFGLVTMVTSITGIAGQFSQLGLSTATVQRRDIDHHQVSNLFWINVAIGATLFVLFATFSPLVAGFYGDPRLLPITVAVSSAFLGGGLTVQHEALLARQMKQAQLTYVRLTGAFAGALVSITLALFEFGYWALVWQEISRIVLVTIGVWIV